MTTFEPDDEPYEEDDKPEESSAPRCRYCSAYLMRPVPASLDRDDGAFCSKACMDNWDMANDEVRF